MSAKPWVTAPISPTCEVLVGRKDCEPIFCEHPTDICYPAAGGGWMALCYRHGKKHLPHTKHIDELISNGETFG